MNVMIPFLNFTKTVLSKLISLLSQSDSLIQVRRHFKLSSIMFATFCGVFQPKNYLLNSLRANYENFDRMKDRKTTITFYAS